MTDVASASDGRRLRREQNREAVIDALIELHREGHYQPNTAEIAERAGLSARSLFRYFDDVDDLNHAAIERQLGLARPLLDIAAGPEEATTAKIHALVEARARLFEAIGPGARAARVTVHRSAVVAAQLHESRSFLRHQIERLFSRELAGERAVLLPAVDALCSFESYELLRRDQGLTRAETATVLEAALTRIVRR